MVTIIQVQNSSIMHIPLFSTILQQVFIEWLILMVFHISIFTIIDNYFGVIYYIAKESKIKS
ncbi:MAG: hypothetical protein WHS65_09365 [Melioribacteraceae bacterium]